MDELSVENRLLNKHRQERKDLNAQIQQMKHSVPKGDKKRKKEITKQIEELERQLKERQENELKSLETEANSEDTTSSRLEGLSIKDDLEVDKGDELTFGYTNVRISKAQKRKDRRAKQDRENQALIEEQHKADAANSQRTLETNRFKSLLENQGLKLYDIPSDGDCMYKAIEHQLSLRGISEGVASLRKRCSKVLREKKDDYLPFISNENGDLIDSEKYETYCENVEKTKAWGGSVELQALSYDLKMPIKILQVDGPPISFGEEFKIKEPLLLSYHRHAYRLGEHYNSVVRA